MGLSGNRIEGFGPSFYSGFFARCQSYAGQETAKTHRVREISPTPQRERGLLSYTSPNRSIISEIGLHSTPEG